MLLEKLGEIYGEYGTIPLSTEESLKIALGNKHMPDDAIDIDTMKATLQVINSVECFEATLKPSSREDSRCTYIWISTGLENESGEKIYLAFTKVKNGRSGEFWCYRVSTYERLLENVRKHMQQNHINPYDEYVNPESTGVAVNDIEKLIFEAQGKPEKELDELDVQLLRYYLAAVETKIEHELMEGITCNCQKNRDENYVCYKIAPIDWRGRDIVICQELIGTSLYKKEIVCSREKLAILGFDTSAYDVPLVRFYEKPEELIIMPTIQQFDFDNRTALNHVLVERIDRFPENVQALEKEALYSLLEKNIRYSITRMLRDYKWGVPFYCLKKNKVQYMIPFYAGDKMGGKADLALIINKGTYFTVVTVLPLESAYLKASTIAPPDNEWIRREYICY